MSIGIVRETYQMKTPSPTTALLIPHAPLHFPLELKLACEAKAEIQKMQKRESTHAIAYGFASLRVRGNRGVIVRYMIAGIVRKHCSISFVLGEEEFVYQSKVPSRPSVDFVCSFENHNFHDPSDNNDDYLGDVYKHLDLLQIVDIEFDHFGWLLW